MSRTMRRAGACALVLLASGCTVTGVGVSTDVGVGYSSGYYEPYGYEYGGWGGGYAVGPWHGRDYHDGYHGGPRGPRPPAFRPPPGGRSMPGLPGGPHHR